MPHPSYDEAFKQYLNDIYCPINEVSKPLEQKQSFAELKEQLGPDEDLTCSFIRMGIPEIEWDIDEMHFYRRRQESKFSVIIDLVWMKTPKACLPAKTMKRGEK